MDSQSFFKSFLIAAFFLGLIAFAAASIRPGTYSGYNQGGYSNTGGNQGGNQGWGGREYDDD